MPETYIGVEWRRGIWTASWGQRAITLLFISLFLPPSFEVLVNGTQVTVTDILIAVLSLVITIRILVRERPQFAVFDKSLILIIVGLLAYNTLTLPLQASYARTAIKTLQLLEIVALLLIVAPGNLGWINRTYSRTILRTVFVTCLAGSIGGIVHYALTGERLLGLVGLADAWYVFGSPALVLFFSLFELAAGGKKWYGLSAIIGLMGIALSLTRGLWLVAAGTLFVAWAILSEKPVRERLGRILALVAASAVVSVLIFDLDRIIERFVSLLNGSQGRNSRLYIWETSWRMFWHNPLGVGLGNHGYLAPEFASPRLRRYHDPASDVLIGAHSDWFRLLAEVGIVGIALYSAFWWRILSGIVHQTDDPVKLTCASFVFLLFLQTFVSDIVFSGGGISILLFYFLYQARSVDYNPQLQPHPSEATRSDWQHKGKIYGT